jgi:hypothetical protein
MAQIFDAVFGIRNEATFSTFRRSRHFPSWANLSKIDDLIAGIRSTAVSLRQPQQRP